MLMDKNQKGFSVVEILIIVVVLGLIGFGGWYVWNRNSTKKSEGTKTTQQAEAPASEAEEEEAPDPTAGWVAYSNEPGDFSFKHPATWVQAANPERCSEGLVLFAPVQESLGRCASESGGQIQVSSVPGDERPSYAFNEAYYKNKTNEAVTVEGVAGSKLSATVSGMEQEVFVGSWPDNTKLVRYVFFTKNKTYLATYVQQPTYPDALSDFNLLVTKTFKFSK
jgi:Tfp pilus assembly protein PilV